MPGLSARCCLLASACLIPAQCALAADHGDPSAIAMLAANNDDQSGPIGGHVDAGGGWGTAQDLFLMATLNGTPTDQFVKARRQAEGFSFRAEDLRNVRLIVDRSFKSDDMVPAAALGQVRFTYDEEHQVLDIQAPDALIATYSVGLDTGRQAFDPADIRSLNGMMLGYGLYGTAYQGKLSVSASLEADLMTRAGTFVTTGTIASAASSASRNVVRYDSYWRYIDPRSVRSYTVGDFSSNAQSWTAAVRLGGFQIASAFEQRADIVTNALPQFSGSAALPSTVDLYVNQQKIYSGQVPSGPFDLKELPYAANGNVRMVVTDANGRQVTMTKPFYYTQGLLRKGLLTYSVDVGAPRLDFGTRSFAYDRILAASGVAKYGLANDLTLELAGEYTSDGLTMAGIGAVASLGGIGAMRGSIAGSRYSGHSGLQYAARVEAGVGGVRFFAGTQRTGGEYFDLGRVSAIRGLARRENASTVLPTDRDSAIASSALARINDQAGVAFQPWFDKTSVSLSYNRIVSSLNRFETMNFSLTRGVGSRVSIYANGSLDLNNRRNYGFYLTLSFRPGQRAYATADYSNSGGTHSWGLQYASAGSGRQGEVNWGAAYRGAQNGPSSESAYVNYQAPQGFVQARVDQAGGAWRGQFDLEGSVLAAGGGIFPAPRVMNSFVVVANAGPHVDVLQGGVRVARTDSSGRALLPNVIPYQPTHVYIDPVALPDGWEASQTEQVAVAAFKQGARIDFGARAVRGASIVLVGADGKPLEAGYVAALDGGERATIGYDGIVYLRGLNARNRLTVDLGPSGTCAATFAYDLGRSANQTIGPVPCK
ncbi:fimbria/pilus outer membrane usher protein [Novosphingobium pokkalii]|nr:fimbrial protein [Novosphingobium pokkalii]